MVIWQEYNRDEGTVGVIGEIPLEGGSFVTDMTLPESHIPSKHQHM